MKKIQLSGFNTSEIIKKIYLKELASTTDKESLNKKALMYGLNPKDLQEIAKSELREMVLCDDNFEVKYLYENSPEYRSARELTRLEKQEIVNR